MSKPTLVFEPLFSNHIATAMVQGPCGARSWRFCTAEEGLRLIQMAIDQQALGYRETRPIRDQIQKVLPHTTQQLALKLLPIETESAQVDVVIERFAGQPCALMGIGMCPLHLTPLPSISMALEVLQHHMRKGKISVADAITAMRAMIAHGVPDMISDAMFSKMSQGAHRDINSESAHRNDLINQVI